LFEHSDGSTSSLSGPLLLHDIVMTSFDPELSLCFIFISTPS